MRTHTLLSTIVSLPLVFTPGVEADERQEAASMEQLVTEVQKVVPPGWSVRYDLIHPRFTDNPGPYPALVVKSEAPLPLEYVNVPSLPARSANDPPDISQKIITIRFIASPYLTEAEHAEARKRNDELHQKRVQFEREHLQNVPWSYKGAEAIPPYVYEPRTEQETQLVRQYAFLWVSTEPRPLPTHHTDRLAFSMRYIPLEFVKIHDAKGAKEYTQIVGALEKIIVPYEPEP